jgi:hypothetical protein
MLAILNEPGFMKLLALLMTGGFLLAMVVVMRTVLGALKGSNWSFPDALSEDVADPSTPRGWVLVASSSRFIAFIGATIMSTVLVFVAAIGIYNVAMGIPAETNIKGLLDALVTGSATFIPYGVNKMSGLISGK